MAAKRKNNQNTSNNLKNESKSNGEMAETQRKDSKKVDNQESHGPSKSVNNQERKSRTK